jgi:uncharacterized protein
MGGIDLLAGLASQSILSFAWQDNTSDMADDLSIEIADPHRIWMQTYLPKKGVEGTGSIKVYNWNLPGDTRTVNCGVFWLDQIDCTGPPNTVEVKAISMPVITGMKTQQRFGSWENTSLAQIAAEIAARNGLTLVWATTKADKNIDRVDQQAPDSEFIRDRAKDNSLNVKIYNRQLVIYSDEEYEARPPVYLIKYGMEHIIGYSFSNKLNDTYMEAINTYTDPKTGKVLQSHFTPKEPPEGTGSILDTNEPEQDDVDGDGNGGGGLLSLPKEGGPMPGFKVQPIVGGKAKAKLREKNKREKECVMRVIGNPDYLSGLNAQLLGFGSFDGKWFISGTLHSLSREGYITELTMRACLDGY